MGKNFLGFLKKIPTAYYRWKQRNENLNTFLSESAASKEKLNKIDDNLAILSSNLIDMKNKINNLQVHVNEVDSYLKIIGKGIRIELLATLYNWRIALVLDKKWASPAEKKEVENIYHLYHDKLNGNGQGEHYYQEIMALPESEKEFKEGIK